MRLAREAAERGWSLPATPWQQLLYIDVAPAHTGAPVPASRHPPRCCPHAPPPPSPPANHHLLACVCPPLQASAQSSASAQGGGGDALAQARGARCVRLGGVEVTVYGTHHAQEERVARCTTGSAAEGLLAAVPSHPLAPPRPPARRRLLLPRRRPAAAACRSSASPSPWPRPPRRRRRPRVHRVRHACRRGCGLGTCCFPFEKGTDLVTGQQAVSCRATHAHFLLLCLPRALVTGGASSTGTGTAQASAQATAQVGNEKTGELGEGHYRTMCYPTLSGQGHYCHYTGTQRRQACQLHAAVALPPPPSLLPAPSPLPSFEQALTQNICQSPQAAASALAEAAAAAQGGAASAEAQAAAEAISAACGQCPQALASALACELEGWAAAGGVDGVTARFRAALLLGCRPPGAGPASPFEPTPPPSHSLPLLSPLRTPAPAAAQASASSAGGGAAEALASAVAEAQAGGALPAACIPPVLAQPGKQQAGMRGGAVSKSRTVAIGAAARRRGAGRGRGGGGGGRDVLLP